jgi:hypothetical protein
MVDHPREAVPGDGIHKAFVTSSTTDQMVEDERDTPPGRGGLVIAALGVVFGDIGTSPVYTFRDCFNPERGSMIARVRTAVVREVRGMSAIGTQQTIAAAAGPSACWGEADALAQS